MTSSPSNLMEMNRDQRKQLFNSLKSLIELNSIKELCFGNPDPYTEARQFASKFIKPGKSKDYYEGILDTLGNLVEEFEDTQTDKEKMYIMICVAESGGLLFESVEKENK